MSGMVDPVGEALTETKIVNWTAGGTIRHSDNGKVVIVTSPSSQTVTLPNYLPPGFSCVVVQGGAGALTFSAASGATLTSANSAVATGAQYAIASLLVTSNTTNLAAVWLLGGSVA